MHFMIDQLAEHIYGNQMVRHQLWQHVHDDTLDHHALMFHGSLGVGKAQFASQLATVILGASEYQDIDRIVKLPQSTAYRQMLHQSHPDFCIINAERYETTSGSIPTEAIHDIRHFLQRQGNSSRRIVMIDALDQCTPNLLQGLLKLLEEPPEKVLFLLISHHPERLLDTLRSRVLKYHFKPLNRQEMTAAINNPTMNISIPADQAGLYLHLAEGSIGKLTTLAETDFSAIHDRLLAMITTPERNNPSLFAFAELVAHPKNQNLAAFRLWLETFSRSLYRSSLIGMDQQPKQWHTLIPPFIAAIDHPSAQKIFADSLKLVDKIQRPPAYLDPEATIVHTAYLWHSLIHHHRIAP